MADEIRADYDQLTQVANQFATQAQAVEELLRKVKAAMDPLQNGGWIGRGSDAFFNEMNHVVLPAVQRLDRALQSGSRVTKEISQKMKQAEEEASSPFRNS